MKHDEIVGLTTREPEKTFEKMTVAIGDSLGDLPSTDDGEDGKDEDIDETEQGTLGEDDKPGWVMGTITQMVQQHMERFQEKQMKLDELTQLGWEETADYFCESDKKYSTSELRVPAVGQPQTDVYNMAPTLTTFGERMERLDIVPGISQIPQGTSQPDSSRIRLGLVKLQSKRSISGHEPAAEYNLSVLLKAKLAEPISLYLSI